MKKKIKEENESKHLIKVMKETPVKYIKWDVQLSPSFERFLVLYADTKMPKKVKEDLMIEWALVDMLKNIVAEKNATAKR